MAGNDRTNVYQDITDSIIADLERGCVPWAPPWDSKAATAPFTIPCNASTRRQYSGINVLTLWAAVTKRKFTGHSWLTFRQALAAGGCVRKGEHGVTVVYADRFTPDAERQRARETGESPRASLSSNASRCSTPTNAKVCPLTPQRLCLLPRRSFPRRTPSSRRLGPSFELAAARRSIIPVSTMCRFRRSRRISSRSIGFVPFSMSSVIMPWPGLCRMADAQQSKSALIRKSLSA